MVEIENPHDMYFKRTMGDINTVRDFVINYFPPGLIEKINLKDMVLVKNDMANEFLEENQSDLIYKIRLDGKEAYLYFLFEHKSYLSYKISIQLLKYLAMIWDLLWEQKERGDRLPVIIPVVFYHGKEKWNIGLKLTDLLEEFPAEVRENIPNFKFVLYDFSTYSDQEIKGNIKLQLFLEMIRYANTDKFPERLRECLLLMKKLDETEEGIEYIKTTVKYFLNVNEVIDYENLKKKSKEIIPERSEEIMTVAEKLREEGREEGKKEELMNTIKIQLEKKFNKNLPEEIKKGINNADINALSKIRNKIFDINNLDEVKDILGI